MSKNILPIVGKEYALTRQRKGKCRCTVDQVHDCSTVEVPDDVWVDITVTKGSLRGIGVGSYRGVGESERVRLSLCYFGELT